LHRIIVKKSIKQIKFYKILKIKLHNIHQNIHYNFRVFPKKKKLNQINGGAGGGGRGWSF
jgi:hypothetical protein